MPAPPTKTFDEEFVGEVLEAKTKCTIVRCSDFPKDVFIATENIVGGKGSLKKGDGVRFGCELLLCGRYNGLHAEKHEALPSLPKLKAKARGVDSDSSNQPSTQRYAGVVKSYNAADKTATFTSDGSTLVKFSNGAPTLTTSSSQIDIVSVFFDGTDYIGSITQGIR